VTNQPTFRPVDGVDLLLASNEATTYLESGVLPDDFFRRVEDFVLYGVCTNCDDACDMNVTAYDHHSTTPQWCDECCEGSSANAFERYVGRPLTETDLRVTFSPDHAWRREDPLTLNEAVTYLTTGELPSDFDERVSLVEEFGEHTEDIDEDIRGYAYVG